MLELIVDLILECIGMVKKEDRRVPLIIGYPLLGLMLFLASFFVIIALVNGVKTFPENKTMGLISILAGLAVVAIGICIFLVALKKVDKDAAKTNGRDFQIIPKGTPVEEVVKAEEKKSRTYGKVGSIMFLVSLILIIILLVLVYWDYNARFINYWQIG